MLKIEKFSFRSLWFVALLPEEGEYREAVYKANTVFFFSCIFSPKSILNAFELTFTAFELIS